MLYRRSTGVADAELVNEGGTMTRTLAIRLSLALGIAASAAAVGTSTAAAWTANPGDGGPAATRHLARDVVKQAPQRAPIRRSHMGVSIDL
jgi:hypothetical protein